jgi:hypothetical protein
MLDLSRFLYLAGAVPFLVLGAAHAIATPRAPHDARGLSPFDPTLAEAMTRSTLRLTRRGRRRDGGHDVTGDGTVDGRDRV